MAGLSLRPSEAVEGAAVAPDGNYTVAESGAVVFDYGGKAPAATALRWKLVGDDGAEFVQHYSAGDPTRLAPSEDGKKLVPANESVKGLNKSTNAFVLLSNTVNAGFPENRVSDDVSIFVGMYAQFQQIPEPERKTLKRDDTRQRVIPVPVKILRLPWEKKGAKTAVAAVAKKPAKAVEAAEAAEAAEEDSIVAKTVQLVKELVDKKGSVTRKEAGIAVFKLKDADRDKMAKFVYSPELLAAVMEAGLTVDGETISS